MFDLVLEDAEVLLLEAVHEFPAIVHHGGVENNEVDVHLDFGAFLGGVRGRRLPGRRRSRRGNGQLRRGSEGKEKSGDDCEDNCGRIGDPLAARGYLPLPAPTGSGQAV